MNPKNPPLKTETVQEVSKSNDDSPTSFPTPAHPTPRFLSKKGAIIALGFIAISFLIAFIIGGFSLAN